ncbi:unnamed protein product [Linum trigynum]|uniref:RRM domain-containing protein n=1 Tax=Linum trigynum TaxID=586398 RepID=A0AAV2DMD9_9ROSI
MEGLCATQEQLHTFHSIDREVFSRMVINLMRDPAECLIIVAAWLWLEQMGYPNIIVFMPSLSDAVVDLLADEMALALSSLTTTTTALPSFMPGTSALMSRTISADLFHRNRFTAVAGIKSFLTTVCSRAFSDILQSICPLARNGSGQLVIPGFPHPVFGNLTVSSPASRGRNGSVLVPPPTDVWGWDPNSSGASEDDKTLFLTFSRGFPVTKEEVTELFTRKYGEGSVVSVLMQENVAAGGGGDQQQPLFARMVMRSVVVVDEVLNGERIAKFRINGKHIWARKYERREQAATPTPPPV